ncbi:MAG: SpoIID/LytB domain-containing protein [Thermoleophilia bacterium]|nr:SpoIID/LytB domain-containing protein [Thermoleophilia bacterium]
MLFGLIGAGLALAVSAPAGSGAPAPTKPAAVTATTFVVSGRGWGHGVGMSQYGALGYAQDGWTYDQILAHFYTGPELGPAPVARVRVLVAEAKGAVTVRSPVPFQVRDVFGKAYPLDAGAVPLGPKLRVPVNGTPTELAGPIVFVPGTAPLELDRPYRGQIEVGVTGARLDAVNIVGLEQYLQGVVAQEMPSSWPDEALKAQAVAARSYALAHRLSGTPFDLYADVRSQVYGGVQGEHPRTTAAIQATKGEVLLWEGKPIDALFHSTSGGRTLDAAEVFGKPVPYLVGVDDPHSDLSPVHRWGPTPVAEAALRRGLKLRTPVTGLTLARGPSGRVTTATVTTAAGSTKVSGATLRLAGGLRSTWVTQLATLSLTRPGGPVVYGKAVSLTGRAKGVKGARLQRRVDGVWTRVGGPGLRATLKLLAPASFRLAAGTLTSSVLRVPVAPRVTARKAAQSVSGTVKPLEPGAKVQLQLDSEGGWLTTAETTTGTEGEYVLTAAEPGGYRVRVAPAQGFAEGLSGRIELR